MVQDAGTLQIAKRKPGKKRQTDRNEMCLEDAIDLELEHSSYDTFQLDGEIFLGGSFCTSNPWFPSSL